MSQSKKASMIETCLGTGIGYITALLTQLIVFPIWDIQTSTTENMAIAGVFTVVSIVRGFFVRRGFNWLHKKGILI